MQEEVGELHEAMSRFATKRKPKSAIDEEVADILAWLLSAWGILFRDRSMDDAFADYYLQDCPVCNLFPCECADRADRAAELIDRGILQSIQSNLHVLEEMLPAARDSLQELQKSIAAATDDESEPTTVHALNETKGTLEKISGGISSADEVGKKSLSIINTITQLLDKVPWT